MQTKHWNANTRNAFFLYAFLTSIVGVWPLQKNTLFFKCRICLACIESVSTIINYYFNKILFTTLFFFLRKIAASITAAGKFIVNCGDIDDGIDAILMLAFGFLVAGKILIHYCYRDQLVIIINSAFTDWESHTINPQSTSIMMNHSRTCNKIARTFYAAGMCSCLFYLLKALVFTDPTIALLLDSDLNSTKSIIPRSYVLPGGCVFDGTNQFIYYFVIINQTIQLTISCATNLGSDTMFIALTTHLVGQFELLQKQLVYIGSEKDLQSNHKSLVKVVKRHCHLMMMAETMEKVYNKVIFLQMFISVVAISIAGIIKINISIALVVYI